MITEQKKYKILAKIVRYRALPHIRSAFKLDFNDIINDIWLKIYDIDFENEQHCFRYIHVTVTNYITSTIKTLNRDKYKANDRTISIISDSDEFNGEEWLGNRDIVLESIEIDNTSPMVRVIEAVLEPMEQFIIKSYYSFTPIEELEIDMSNAARQHTIGLNELAQLLFTYGFKTTIISKSRCNQLVTNALQKLKPYLNND